MNELEKLLTTALAAVNAASTYAQRAGFMNEMYQANRAWHILYNSRNNLTANLSENRERV
jgi:hypothetical protein